jgi:hypothetical protein
LGEENLLISQQRQVPTGQHRQDEHGGGSDDIVETAIAIAKAERSGREIADTFSGLYSSVSCQIPFPSADRVRPRRNSMRQRNTAAQAVVWREC